MGNHNITRTLTGRKAEHRAAVYLKNRGYRIIETNFSTRCGEIDIIALDEKGFGDIVFVEVKYRRKTYFGAPHESVDYRKQERLKRTAEEYILSRGLDGKEINFRFDVISISGNGKIEHFKDAFV